MAQKTRGELRAMLALELDLPNEASSDGRTYLNDCLNIGARRVWGMHHWFERRDDDTIFTVAPYSTGLCDFAQGSTVLAGTGTTWTSDMSARKIARSIGSPFYRFAYVSATAGSVPTGGYAEASASGSPYVIFQDEYSLSAPFESVISAQLLAPGRTGGLTKVNEATMDRLLFVAGATGVPTMYADTLNASAGVRRLRVYPIPNAIFRIRVLGLIAFTDMTADGDFCVLGARKERLVLLAAALEAQRAADVRHVTNEQEFQLAVAEQWGVEQTQQPLVTPRGTGRRGFRGPFLSDDNTGA